MPQGVLTAYGRKHPDSTLSVLQLHSWPPTAELRAHLLMLDRSSAGGEGTAIWDATRARLEPSNTCFVKIDTLWST